MRERPVLGILTLYLSERKTLEERPVYEKMTLAGRKIGLEVIVFTPEDVEDASARVHALVFHPRTRKWGRRWVRIPPVIYDRARYQRTPRFDKLLLFRRKNPHLVFLSRPLRNKWTLYRSLIQVKTFRPHLPATRLYESPRDVAEMLRRFSSVYFKPVNGTGGRGILRIDKLRGGLLQIQGRNHARMIVNPRKVHREALPSVLRSWDRHGDKYIVQQGLNNRLPDGRVHDYRMLVQKNGQGLWEVTGCAGRIGARSSITSNLHGGGTAESMQSLLQKWVENDDQVVQIRQTAEELGLAAAEYLEDQYGELCELALDLAIDRKGDIWLLEVNQKPSREVFIQAGEREVYRRAYTRPLEYALWKCRQRGGKQRRSVTVSSEESPLS